MGGSGYDLNEVVAYNGNWYTSLISNNFYPTTDATKWAVGVIPGSAAGGPIWSLGVTPGTNASYWNAHSTLATTPWVGQNFTTPGAQTIAFATIFPSSDIRFANNGANNITWKLWASNTSPGSNPTAGTLLGTTVALNSAGSVSITSSDTTTTWKFIWVTGSATANDGGVQPATVYASQVQFYAPNVANGTVITLQIEGLPLLYTTTISTWRLGIFSNTTGWPTCGTYASGRLWLGGVVANRADASNSNDLFNMAPTGPDGTVADSNAIQAALQADDANPMFWLAADLQGILAGTQSGEFLIYAPTTGVLSPTNIKADRVTKIGSANVEPRKTGLVLTFVQTYRRKLMEYFSDVMSGKFTSPNLSLTAQHFMKRRVAEIAYQQESTPIIWSRMDDGSLCGVTYKRESLLTAQGPAFSGWHEHVLGGGQTVASICSSASTDGFLDALTAAVLDPTTGLYSVQVLTNIPEEDMTADEAFNCDAGVAPTTVTAATVLGVPVYQMTGMLHLASRVVSVYLNGIDAGDLAVGTDGVVNVPIASIPTALRAAVAALVTAGTLPVVVGFTYTSDGQIVRPATMAESGARNGPALGKKRKVAQFAALLNGAQGVSFGTRFDKLFPALFRTPGGVDYAVNTLYSGVYWNTIQDDYSYDGMLCWRVTRPNPLTVCALECFLETQDK